MIDIMSLDLIDLLYAAGEREQSFAAGTYLFHTGDRVKALFIILLGEVRLVRHQVDGTSIVLQRAEAGKVLAEASLFSASYHCDAIAGSAALVRAISVQALRQRFREDPDFAEAWATHLAHEVQSARFRSEVIALRTVAARLDAWLSWHKGSLPRRGAWKQIADQIGVSAEALYREIAKRRRTAR